MKKINKEVKIMEDETIKTAVLIAIALVTIFALFERGRF